MKKKKVRIKTGLDRKTYDGWHGLQQTAVKELQQSGFDMKKLSIAGLHNLGLPKDSLLRGETTLKTDKFVLIARGSIQETAHAGEIINQLPPRCWSTIIPCLTQGKFLLGRRAI